MSNPIPDEQGIIEKPGLKPQLHISALNMLNFCGEQFRRRYILKEKRPPGVAMIVGTAADRSVTRNLQSKLDTNQLLPLAQVKQIAADTLNAEWQNSVALDADELVQGIERVKGEAIDKAVRLSSLHATELAPKLQPTHVQRQWTLDIVGYDMSLAGTIDVQEGSDSVRDTKTKGKSPSEDIVHHDHQLTAYAMAAKVIDGKVPEQVTLDCMVDNKTPILKVYKSTRNEKDFQAFLARVENAIVALQKGVFVPAKQTDFLCSPKYCGFFSSCKFVMQPKSVSVPSNFNV